MVDTPQTSDGLDLVIDFVNTLDVEASTDELHTSADLAAWLHAHDLTTAHTAASETDHRHGLGLREALRALMLANNGGAADERASGELERAARRGELSVHFTAPGTISLAPGTGAIDGALAQLLVPVAQSIADGSWQRVKACRSDDCRWAFYDRSRNRSGVWCEMAVCGNRTKVRAYRKRTPR
jgi:predicted RNA-binding Zn ribbon-like protein